MRSADRPFRGLPLRAPLLFVALTHLMFLLPAVFTGAGGGGRLPPPGDSVIELDNGWEYRWGDSPFDAAGIPVWTHEGRSDLGAADSWRAIEFPSNPPERGSRTNVWFRLRLPQESLRDARIFVTSIDLIAEVYLEGRRIYAFGSFDEGGRGEFRGWPWHLISLPEGYGGKDLYVRVFSDYRDIGLWGRILLGSGFDQIRRIHRRDSVRLVVAMVSLIISLVFLLVYLLRREQRSSLFLSLVALVLVARVLSQTYLRQNVIASPLVAEYVKAASYFILPVFVILFLREFLGQRYRLPLKVAWISILGLFAATMLGALSGLFRLAETYLLFDIVSVATMILLGVLSVKAALGGNAEARLVSLNFLAMGVLAVYSILVSNGVFPWTDEIDYLLLFIFALGLTAILLRRLVGFYRRLEEYTRQVTEQSEQLKALNQNLERKVAERTRQLEMANRKLREEKITLQISSITDGLTGLYNRTYVLDRFERELGEARRYDKRLSVIMFDLDHFKRVNDAYGHQIGDTVMQRVTGIFKSVIRESDLAGRYGGEEFIIVLPETDCTEAGVVAERIRAQVQSLSWAEPGLEPTISGGVAEFAGESADRLLQRADSLLYQAKELGRNRVVTQSQAYPRLVDRAT